MSVSFCLPHHVAASAFMICSGLCACTEMLWMCVLYVSFGSNIYISDLTPPSASVQVMALCHLDLFVVSLYVLCYPVNGSVCFVNCLVKQFTICLGVYVILLLNVMFLCVVGGSQLDRLCMVFHRYTFGTFGCVAMDSALFCIFRSRLLVYSAGSGMNIVQVVLSGFSMSLFCPGKNFLQLWLYIFLGCTCACGCDGDVI